MLSIVKKSKEGGAESCDREPLCRALVSVLETELRTEGFQAARCCCPTLGLIFVSPSWVSLASGLFLFQRLLEQVRRILETQLLCEQSQRSIYRDFVVFHLITTLDYCGIPKRWIVNISNQAFGRFG